MYEENTRNQQPSRRVRGLPQRGSLRRAPRLHTLAGRDCVPVVLIRSQVRPHHPLPPLPLRRLPSGVQRPQGHDLRALETAAAQVVRCRVALLPAREGHLQPATRTRPRGDAEDRLARPRQAQKRQREPQRRRGTAVGRRGSRRDLPGGKERNKHARERSGRRGTSGKHAVAGVRERGGGVRTAHVDRASAAELLGFVSTHVEYGSTIHTDEWRAYSGLRHHYTHHRVAHSLGEYSGGSVHTNGIEGFWSLVKRSYVGVYHWWNRKHLHRYLSEHTARHNLGPGPGSFDAFPAGTVGVTLQYAILTA
ncbi:MAG: IS1595 family transposase [Acidimicrobiaceae bacterium]|nr:IS1595 family transposase [Acidimicrobiaceae bacterium]